LRNGLKCGADGDLAQPKKKPGAVSRPGANHQFQFPEYDKVEIFVKRVLPSEPRRGSGNLRQPKSAPKRGNGSPICILIIYETGGDRQIHLFGWYICKGAAPRHLSLCRESQLRPHCFGIIETIYRQADIWPANLAIGERRSTVFAKPSLDNV
jgi:hypothetical protein